MKEIIEQAYQESREDVTKFVWKGRKTRVNGKVLQEERRLVDVGEAALNEYYSHCVSMLNNPDRSNPGRYIVLKNIKDQMEKCNCELFLRWLSAEKNLSRFQFRTSIQDTLQANPDFKLEELVLANIADGVPSEFSNLPLNLIMDGCLDRLGKFYRKHITLSFLLKQGIWFTSSETKDLTEKDETTGQERNKMDVVRERLKLDRDTVLHATPKGLTYTQFASMIKLRSNKYSDLSTTQLQTLRDRILFMLEDDVRFHIKQWEQRMSQIEKVADYKGIKLLLGSYK